MLKLNVKAMRERRGVSQSYLAKHLSITVQAVSAWERGVNAPSAETLPQIAQLLGCTINDLYRDDRDERSE